MSPSFCLASSLPSPSNLPFLVSSPLSPNYRVTVARRWSGGSTPGHAVPVAAAPGERRERAVRAEGARGARCPRRPCRRCAAGARGARRPRRPRHRHVKGGRKHAARAVHVAAAPPEFSPSPLSRLKRNAVTPVVMRPMTVTDNQLGRGRGEEGDKDKG